MPKPNLNFLEGPTLDAARELLNYRLCRCTDGNISKWQITETEAYDGPSDLASHARAGRTKRTTLMFGPPGIWYIYLCYGVHWLLNVVTGPENYPAAVLIRGAGEINGPGRLTKALDIKGDLNGAPVSKNAGLWLEPGKPVEEHQISRTPRIGVDYAGPDWSQRPYRLVVKS